MKDGIRKQLSALEIDMAGFIKRLIKGSDDRVSGGNVKRDEANQAHYDEATELVKRFDKIAEEVSRRRH